MEKRTDLALEVQESIREKDVEIPGVVLKKYRKKGVQVTYVSIESKEGETSMGKPMGTYVTLEFQDEDGEADIAGGHGEKILSDTMKKFVTEYMEMKDFHGKTLVVGLGNRLATPDSLGPHAIDNVVITNHLIEYFGEEYKKENHLNGLSALAPGVMAQTGMETSAILKGVVDRTKPELVIIIDSLAARSVRRLGTTVQLTDTGIHPGAGIGNERNPLDREFLGVPVLCVGVPTVVDAGTIVGDCMEEALQGQGFSETEISSFIDGLGVERFQDLFVTPGNIDALIRDMGNCIAAAVSRVFS